MPYWDVNESFVFFIINVGSYYMKILLTIICLGLAMNFSGRACSCEDWIGKPFELEYTDKFKWIFVAEIKGSVDNFFDIELKEIFKGNPPKNLRVKNDISAACSYDVMTGQTWLIYADHTIESFIVIDACTRSRDLNNLRLNFPLRPPDVSIEQWDIKQNEYEKMMRKLNDNELAQLNKLK